MEKGLTQIETWCTETIISLRGFACCETNDEIKISWLSERVSSITKLLVKMVMHMPSEKRKNGQYE